MPTNPERMVWDLGDANGLRGFDTPCGRIGSLLCRESYWTAPLICRLRRDPAETDSHHCIHVTEPGNENLHHAQPETWGLLHQR